MGEIVVGVDGSEGAAESLRWAVAEGERRGWSVTVVLAWAALDQHHADGQDRYDPDYSDEDAAAALDVMVSKALGDGADVTKKTVCDLPARGLLEASADADLVVVGARGMGGFKGMLLGSVSQAVLQQSTIPVAVVRGDGSGNGKVVVGVDGSDSSKRALQWAIEAAAARSSTLTAVNAWQPPVFGGYPQAGLAIDPAELESTSREIVTDALAEVDTSALSSDPEIVAHLGGAAEGVLTVGDGADLIVLGSRGRGGFKGLLLGSVTLQVTQHSTSTVVVIPHQR